MYEFVNGELIWMVYNTGSLGIIGCHLGGITKGVREPGIHEHEATEDLLPILVRG
jgi:hypothetical protein